MAVIGEMVVGSLDGDLVGAFVEKGTGGSENGAQVGIAVSSLLVFLVPTLLGGPRVSDPRILLLWCESNSAEDAAKEHCIRVASAPMTRYRLKVGVILNSVLL